MIKPDVLKMNGTIGMPPRAKKAKGTNDVEPTAASTASIERKTAYRRPSPAADTRTHRGVPLGTSHIDSSYSNPHSGQ
jgi:hypothetical protein